MKLDTLLKQAGCVWLLMGTVMMIITAYRSFENTLAYELALIVVWLIIAGLPFMVLYSAGRWAHRRSIPVSPPEEGKEPKT